ncbi:MAG TPA: xylulokinase, partial [Chloroflexia bacterium]|nr:xylulokinase [Chloroflexia bacterium]
LADVFDSEIVLTNVTEGAAFGAALLAGVGACVYEDVREACACTIRVTDSVEPGANVSAYEDYYPIYRELYPALAPYFKQIGKVIG